MPRILAPSSSNSFRRGSTSSIRSHSSWGSSGSSRSLRHRQSLQITRSPYLRTSSSVRKSQVGHDNKMDWPGFDPDDQCLQDHLSTSNPPSIVSSDVSVQSDMVPSLSRLSLSSHNNFYDQSAGCRSDERSFQISHGTSQAHQSVRSTVRRASSQSSQKSFLPSFQAVEEDSWGQFVDVAHEDEMLAKRSKYLSMTRHSSVARANHYTI
mmetsp:Transcript_25722/g.53254  ORF Transcript_25722/g.53254 Transcript_25722/m.53254 type:complete len:209 (+) Transcript_25722:113-739(+)